VRRMARWTETWLSGLGAAGVEPRAQDGWRGRRLGLPPEGAGAVATTGSRAAAFVLDIVFGALIGRLVIGLLGDLTADQQSIAVNAAFAVEVLLLTALTGQSLGKRVLGIRVVRPAQLEGPPGFLPAAIRTALVMLVLPAVIMDRDGRGLHDRAAGTLVVRTRAARSFAG
jgi:uncharacterized RDD family membrane protein YckC